MNIKSTEISKQMKSVEVQIIKVENKVRKESSILQTQARVHKYYH